MLTMYRVLYTIGYSNSCDEDSSEGYIDVLGHSEFDWFAALFHSILQLNSKVVPRSEVEEIRRDLKPETSYNP